ncbi:TetR/AcrR family transcriptional regulator [Sneathiella glossodoripedis]|uniref:TetR/AcrR family transcriptional regulator n=1 Tax=Sneathiella glossodoripedis TaxID=418853 RepID=UPI001902870D|nr:TetR/AcrR family transcriptional regulator [Sneathiella glossodoripedis]
MTEITSRRKSNAERSAQMRQKLVDTARALFVSDGYAQTSTPDIVKAADVTRGALYHHFADKKDLFLAVIRQENEAVAKEIEDAANTSSDGIDMLMEGASAYFDAMQRPGRCRLLLLDGPSVLGYEVMQQIDAEFSAKSLKEGLTAAEGMSQPDAFRLIF